MEYYDALKAKWSTLAGTTEEKLVAINALTVDGPSQPIPVLTVMTYLRSNNLWMPIKAAQATSQGAAAAVDYNSDPRVQTLDVSLPAVQGMILDLVSHSLLTQEQVLALVALGVPKLTWWKTAGYTSPISADDLAAAGGLN
jgi:hypothetical protein